MFTLTYRGGSPSPALHDSLLREHTASAHTHNVSEHSQNREALTNQWKLMREKSISVFLPFFFRFFQTVTHKLVWWVHFSSGTVWRCLIWATRYLVQNLWCDSPSSHVVLNTIVSHLEHLVVLFFTKKDVWFEQVLIERVHSSPETTLLSDPLACLYINHIP